MVEGRAPERSALTWRDLTRAFGHATRWLGVFVEEVNALNVYPVPDGDTGTNMHLTMQSVRRQLTEEAPRDMAGFAHAVAYGSLLGARGNSGVILSQVLKGFADSVRTRTSVDGAGMAEALASGTAAAYAAVMKPVEGTILTVARAMSQAATEASEADPRLPPVEVMRRAREAGGEALERTPEQLPILAQAGVVDAGGLGLLRIVDGLIGYFDGADLPAAPRVSAPAQKAFEEQVFGFCTEFLLADVAVPTREIQELVAPYGDSLLVVGAEGFVKGHIHTEEPEKLLGEVSHYGRMVRSKVEDMTEQHSEILASVDPRQATAPSSGLVTVSDGYGVTRAFRSLGARVVGGGQTDNPSVEDIVDAVRSLGARDVIVMPNNKNVVMAAERVAGLVPEKHVTVLPTRTLGQGLAAAVVFQQDEEVASLIPSMREAAEHAVTLEVTTASRTVTLDGVEAHEGEFIGLVDGELRAAAADASECLLALLAAVSAEDYDVASLFHGTSVDADQLARLRAAIEERYPVLEVESHPGSPDLYPFLMTLE